jgi:hypothetical protein
MIRALKDAGGSGRLSRDSKNSNSERAVVGDSVERLKSRHEHGAGR